ncbi:TIR domain-containing protein [Leifsonia sp. 1010]|uniref:TIR domain-containing protein n=1 Tax=Leifsonia sp. 1010 TaxID=2817769 RepID=UPI002857234B|nr:TIR domain-containing protein [Leifsonia sp. 1010]MDR6614045.1 putative nucleotide-binding protein [Leifsonia sp. 1010]
MSITIRLSGVAMDKSAWWEVVSLASHRAAESVQRQIDDPSFPEVPAALRAEQARAKNEGVEPGMAIEVESAEKGARIVSENSGRQPLARTSLDWLDADYDTFNFTIVTPDLISVRCEQWRRSLVTVSIDASSGHGFFNSEAADAAAASEKRLADDIEPVLREHLEPPPPPPAFRVIMGHGNDQQWRVLRDELRDHHGFDVSAFEGQPRAGQTINTVLEDMATQATVALIVLTKADEMADGRWRARQNVVHEVGFFQGRLGWTNAIAIVEEGVDLFSNLDGTQQIRFPAGNISAATGNVAATLNAKNRSREA